MYICIIGLYLTWFQFLASPRILRLYAEENAIDDTIYHIGEALRKGVIEPDVFLKVRSMHM